LFFPARSLLRTVSAPATFLFSSLIHMIVSPYYSGSTTLLLGPQSVRGLDHQMGSLTQRISPFCASTLNDASDIQFGWRSFFVNSGLFLGFSSFAISFQAFRRPQDGPRHSVYFSAMGHPVPGDTGTLSLRTFGFVNFCRGTSNVTFLFFFTFAAFIEFAAFRR